MKKFLVLAVVLGLVAGSLAAPAVAGKKKKKKSARVERVVELAYDVGSPGVSGAVGLCLAAQVEGTACINTPVGIEEKFVMIEVDDASGLAPAGILAQDSNPDSPGFEIFADFCGSTDEPIEIPLPGAELRISLYTAPSPTCPGVTTTGTIKATLSNLP